MKNITANPKRTISLLLCFLFLFTLITGCTPSPVSSNASSSGKPSEESKPSDSSSPDPDENNSDDDTENGEPGVSSEGWIDDDDDGGGDDSDDGQNGDDSSSDEENDDTSLSAPSIKQSQRDFVVKLLDYHPGVPGYDALYTSSAMFQSRYLSVGEFSVKSKTSGVSVNGTNKILVPESVWSKGSVVEVEATYLKDTKYKVTLQLKYENIWKLSFQDDFNSGTLDSNIWKIQTGDVRSDNQYSICTPDSVVVQNGCMVLKTEKLSTPYNGKNYSHSIIDSSKAFNQQYGVFTARVKLPLKGGVYGGFWLMPQGRYGYDNFFVATDTEKILRCSEIDIMENFGPSIAPGKSSSTLHFWGESGKVEDAKGKTVEIPDFQPEKFYEYTCVWTKYAVYFFVDGVLNYTVTDIAPDNSVAGYMLFSLFDAPAVELDSGYDYWYGQLFEADYPQVMEIDWVKAYK